MPCGLTCSAGRCGGCATDGDCPSGMTCGGNLVPGVCGRRFEANFTTGARFDDGSWATCVVGGGTVTQATNGPVVLRTPASANTWSERPSIIRGARK